MIPVTRTTSLGKEKLPLVLSVVLCLADLRIRDTGADCLGMLANIDQERPGAPLDGILPSQLSLLMEL